MADATAKDAQAKQRIISHMNTDHHDSVIRYLEHYHGISSWTAYSGQITDVSLADITFTCGAGTFVTELEPPMTSFREARERLVAMDKECVQKLGRSDITVREFVYPRGLPAVQCLLIIATFIAFSRRENYGPNGVLASFLWPPFRELCHRAQPLVIWIILVLHGAEATVLAQGRLKRHNVNIRSKVWWMWVADAFLEGFGAFLRFDSLVEQKQAEKEKQRH